MKHKLPLTLPEEHIVILEHSLRTSIVTWRGIQKSTKKIYPDSTYASRQIKFMRRALDKINVAWNNKTHTIIFTPRELEAGRRSIESETTKINSAIDLLDFLKKDQLDEDYTHFPGYTLNQLKENKNILIKIDEEMMDVWNSG